MPDDRRGLAQRVRQLNETTDGTCGQAYSRDGTVFLEVNPFGTIKSIWLAEHAGERGMDVLAEMIIDTHRKARQFAMMAAERAHDRFINGDRSGGHA